MKRSIALLLLFLFSACSSSGVDVKKEDDAALTQLARGEAESRLAETRKELEDLDSRLRSAQARRDSLEIQASADVTRRNRVDAAEEEIAGLLAKQGILMHRQHVLEARLRELNGVQEP